MLDDVMREIISAIKKAPELTQELIEQQLAYHRQHILNSLDAVPMHVFDHQVSLLRQVMLKLNALEEKMAALESASGHHSDEKQPLSNESKK